MKTPEGRGPISRVDLVLLAGTAEERAMHEDLNRTKAGILGALRHGKAMTIDNIHMGVMLGVEVSVNELVDEGLVDLVDGEIRLRQGNPD